MLHATLEATPVIALAGNPNSGKTALFNAITGSRQHVGNWPGVTVEKKEGTTSIDGNLATIIDLPGTYAFSSRALDETIARDFIVNEQPDLVINVVDSTNLERNLYLTLQLLEMEVPIIVALNMFDEAESLNLQIDVAKLSQSLGVPVIPTVAPQKSGINELLSEALRTISSKISSDSRVSESLRQPEKRAHVVDYGPTLEARISSLEKDLEKEALKDASLNEWHLPLPRRYQALKLLEAEPEALDVIAKARYDRAADIAQVVIGQDMDAASITPSQAIDKIVLNPWLAYPIFLGVIWMMFKLTFTLSEPIADLFLDFFDLVGEQVASLLTRIGTPTMLNDFIVDGVIAGVGAVLEFAPPIFMLFMVIALLEDVGYMARAAFLSDRLMRAVGLHGKAFIPMILGFGCNVTGILATRSLDSPRDRLISIMINPLISCAGRLPVYVLFATAFFGERRGLVVFSLYVLGVVLAALAAKVLSFFVEPDASSTFVMELPPYRLPRPGAVLTQTWERGKEFLHKAGTIILLAVAVIWLLANLPPGTGPGNPNSYIGRIGAALAPVFRPAGFDAWEAVVALIFGVVAKELIIGTLGVLYGAGEAGLIQAIQGAWTPLSAYAFLVMSLVYIPCVATIVSIRRETNSWKWTAVAVTYTSVLGWGLAVVVYQVGSLLGF
ncbi:MAG: ferrous iron transport protein B [Firmicutes bacterium]|nr:ferrous iron transport protein B [Bacillota bacterium]